MQTMRRTLTVVVFCAVGHRATGRRSAACHFGGPERSADAAMLTVDSIMRGPKLVGSAPTNVRWSADSSKIYFSWQKAADDRATTYVANRDGTGLAPFTGTPDTPVAGRLDGARRRMRRGRERRRRDRRRRDRRPARRHAHRGDRIESPLGASRHSGDVHARWQSVPRAARRRRSAGRNAAHRRDAGRPMLARPLRRSAGRRRRARRARRPAGEGAQGAAAQRERPELTDVAASAPGRKSEAHPVPAAAERPARRGWRRRAEVAADVVARRRRRRRRSRASSLARQNVVDLELSGDEKYRVGARQRTARGHRAQPGRAELRYALRLSRDHHRSHGRGRRRAAARCSRRST